MPHEATVDHTEVLTDDVVAGARMRAKENLSKNSLNSEVSKQVTNVRPPTPEQCTNFDDDDTSSDEGTSDQLALVSGVGHKITGPF